MARAAEDLGPLVLPVPTKRELVAALVSVLDVPGLIGGKERSKLELREKVVWSGWSVLTARAPA
ncbi:hypothetical protein [Kitasatospora griseola]|uniref:hypothetical protein n=1 Tax=Kitasatospora griseola TaxID=2064 RepID=UPI00166FD493|nr:hypothetical protein [Kitasatospora griseola]GGR05593.1 hypothetical protein GCM10010195_71120 [Kitasatospora griseola]